MTLEEVGNWQGTVSEIGPLYPMVGSEVILVIIGLVIWIGWHVCQMKMENANYRDDLETLKKDDNMSKALRGERILRPL